ncbi:hypothetical protein J437_LFUL012122 [Ladona fulva]|uniref:Uncharacterized protein n=1 Tax=Ladona fulva TaxID=123851 RepID=A0A8K0P4F4_LADFU|nr:hypothetical protein J437_LFUL012122 [Ladona fulva]
MGYIFKDAILVAGGAALYPIGWDNREVKESCGNTSDIYDLACFRSDNANCFRPTLILKPPREIICCGEIGNFAEIKSFPGDLEIAVECT